MKTKYVLSISLFVFVAIFSGIMVLKPSCFYKDDGSLREFGVGYQNKTVFPLWVASLTLGISIYYIVLLLYYNAWV